MPKQNGALCFIKKNSVTIGGGRTIGLTINGSAVDVQDQNDEGFQDFLDGKIIGRSIELSIDGYTDDTVLRDVASATTAAGKFMDDISLVFPNGDNYTGTFFLASYAENGPYEDGVTMTATFQSSGKWVYAKGVAP